MVATRESSELAKTFISTTVDKQDHPVGLTIHSDRGASMASKPVAFLLADLGITKSHSRPHVSNDNRYSGSNFKTLKYRSDFPDRFGSIQDARVHCERFYSWYNHDHRFQGVAVVS